MDRIAEVVGVHVDTASDWSKGFSESPEPGLSEFPPGFEPPIYNVWKKQASIEEARERQRQAGHEHGRGRVEKLVADLPQAIEPVSLSWRNPHPGGIHILAESTRIDITIPTHPCYSAND